MKSLARMLWHDLSSRVMDSELDYALLLPREEEGGAFYLDSGTSDGIKGMANPGMEVTVPLPIQSENRAFVTKGASHHQVWLPIFVSEHCVAVIVLLADKRLNKRAMEEIAKNAKSEISLLPLFGAVQTGLVNEEVDNSQTGLPGRKGLLSALTELRRTETSGCLLYIDIDEFQIFNDRAGKDAGDHALRNMASMLKEFVEQKRKKVDLYHYGSDEFAILLHKGSEQEGCELAHQIKAYKIKDDNLANAVPGCSIGVYSFNGAEVSDALEVIERSKKVLLLAKEHGRDGVQRHSNMKRRSGILCTLVEAIERNELYYDYQPVVDTDNGDTLYFESLARVLPRDNKQLSPATFIPILETSSGINKLDKYTTDYAFNYLQQTENTNPRLCLGINVSGKSMEKLDWLNYLEKKLALSKVSPKRLVIEMTETWMRRNRNIAKAIAKEVKALGCCFALDDFGAGSYNYQDLLSMPADYVKLDASLISKMCVDIAHHRSVEHIVSAAKSMGMELIAEGIEDQRVLDAVKNVGIRYVQGYLLGRPSRKPSMRRRMSV